MNSTPVRAVCVALVLLWTGVEARLSAQAMETIGFDEAIRRAVTNNPTIQQASAAIVRADALFRQARAVTLPALGATFTTNIVEPVTKFNGVTINPRVQTQTEAALAIPILTPVLWAQRAQAGDQVVVAQASAADIRRQIAVATAEAYLSVIAERRQVDLNERARDNSSAHYDYARQRFEGGVGSRLNMLRAQKELSTNEARVEAAELLRRRGQEALGVLVASERPIDVSEEPMFEAATEVAPPPDPAGMLIQRSDIRLLAAQQKAAERVVGDSWKERLPSVTALFTPQIQAPAGLFALSRASRATVIFAVPLLDSGLRKGRLLERQALLDTVKIERLGTERQATSEIRMAREAIRLTERALDRSRQAVGQANEVARISDIAFREGATTNIEVIDAQREARDAETTAAIAEDAVRRSRLDLLVAEGRFPQ